MSLLNVPRVSQRMKQHAKACQAGVGADDLHVYVWKLYLHSADLCIICLAYICHDQSVIITLYDFSTVHVYLKYFFDTLGVCMRYHTRNHDVLSL